MRIRTVTWFRREEIIATCGSRNDIFAPHPRRRRHRVKITFSHARALHHHEYLCARQVLESGIEPLAHPPGGVAAMSEKDVPVIAPFVAPTLMETLMPKLSRTWSTARAYTRASPRFNCCRRAIMPRGGIAWRSQDKVNFRMWPFHYYRELSAVFPRSSFLLAASASGTLLIFIIKGQCTGFRAFERSSEMSLLQSAGVRWVILDSRNWFRLC